MVRCKPAATTNGGSSGLTERLQIAKSPEIARAIAKLHRKYGKFAVPLAELRRNLDREMGDKTLTEELYAMREGR